MLVVSLATVVINISIKVMPVHVTLYPKDSIRDLGLCINIIKDVMSPIAHAKTNEAGNDGPSDSKLNNREVMKRTTLKMTIIKMPIPE